MMTLRPEPVTSKFRRYYKNEIIPIYHNSNLSDSSSAGSTASLTSILHHENCIDLKMLQYDSNDLPNNITDNSTALNNLSTNNHKFKKPNGVIREYINSSATGICRIDKNPDSHKKSCKRIIARKPDYPGFRVIDVAYDGQLWEKRFQKPIKPVKNYHKSGIRKLIMKPVESKMDTNQKPESQIRIKRKKKSTKTDENAEKETSTKSALAISNHNYTECEFTSVSNSVPIKSETPGTTQPISTKKLSETESKRDGPPASSANDVDSFISEDAPESSFTSRSDLGTDGTSNADINTDKPPHRLLSAWEGWFLKKEEQDRKLIEKERKKMELEEAKKKEESRLKQERRALSEKKIMEWLKKKEEERLKMMTVKQKKERKEKEILECKKDDTLKQSSEKYIAWKMKKLELQKEQERQIREKASQVEQEKAVKNEKAQNAFKTWLEQHRDHQLPVPYSYGISDGKLTSYYDKTSNPPPAYFNPNLWVSILETK